MGLGCLAMIGRPWTMVWLSVRSMCDGGALADTGMGTLGSRHLGLTLLGCWWGCGLGVPRCKAAGSKGPHCDPMGFGGTGSPTVTPLLSWHRF